MNVNRHLDLATRNARTNKIIDKVKDAAPTTVDRNMIDKVLRPIMIVFNECQVNNVNTDELWDALISVIASAVTELLVRTIPAGDASALAQSLDMNLQAIREQTLKSVAVNFNVNFEPVNEEVAEVVKLDS